MHHDTRSGYDGPMLRCALLATILVAGAPTQESRPAAAWSARVQALVAPLQKKGEITDLALGIVDGTATHEFFFGPAGVDAHTLFEIGSVTKVFTGIALASLVHARELALTDTLAQHLPAELAIPPQGRPIQLVDLATHTSGLSRLPPNLVVKNQGDPYRDYRAADLREALPVVALTRAPGKYEYSNFGVGLLGWVLARHEQCSFDALLATHVCEPLGLVETRCELDAALAKRLVGGHDEQGRPVPHWHFTEAMAGAGALRSSLADMLRFVRANLGLVAPESAPVLQLAQQVHFAEVPAPQRRLGLGWHFEKLPHCVALWHNGGTGGFRTFLGFVPETKTGVVVLANRARSVDPLGFRLLQLANEPRTTAGSRTTGK